MAVASTFDNHIILVGLGHLGYQAAQDLINLHQTVVVIESDPKADLVEAVRDKNIPVIINDANREASLEAAGVTRAKTIMLCTQNDSLNLQIAVKAKAINPKIKVVVRIFDADFAQAIENQFGFQALSASSISAPAFAASAAGVEITRPISIEGHALSLAKVHLKAGSKLANKDIAKIEEKFDISIVYWQHDDDHDFHPPSETLLSKGDAIAILAKQECITKVLNANG